MAQRQDAMISPAQRRRNKVRQSIIATAEHMFERDGEAGLSIRKLAEEIDYTPGAIYKYFESKQELIDELKEAFFALLMTEMDEFSGAQEDYPAYAHDFIKTYITVALAKPHHYGAAFSGIPDARAPVQQSSDKSVKVQAFMKLRAMIEMGVALNVFRQDLNITMATKSIWAALHGFVSLATHMPNFQTVLDDGPKLSEDAFISRHVAFILQGISK